VWTWIEGAAGRPVLDRILARFAAAPGSWTTEDLRRALEAETGRDWLEDFRRFVYGREAPPAPGGPGSQD